MAMATDYHRIFYKTDPCDSIILVHEVAGGVDSAWWTSCSSVDTSIDKAGLSDGTHNFAVLFYFDNDTVAYSVSEAVVIGAVSVDLSGSGLDVLTLYLIDTSGTDAGVATANVTLSNLAGTPYSTTITKSGGYTKINFTATDTFLVTASKPGYVLPSAETLIVAATSTDSLFGHDITISPPAAASACRLYDYIYTTQLGAVEGATIVASLTGKNLRDSCLNVNIATPSAAITTSDSTGYWYLDLAKSYCYDSADSIFYQVTIVYPNGASPMTSKRVYITDSATQRMAW